MFKQVIAILLLTMSCHSKQTDVKNGRASGQNVPAGKSKKNGLSKELKLDHIVSLPDAIDGCGEYFSFIEEKPSSDTYVFVSNLTQFAIIKIDGKEIHLDRDTLRSHSGTNSNYVVVYSNKVYTVTLSIEQVTKYDEGGMYEGTLEVLYNNKRKVFKVHGESGC